MSPIGDSAESLVELQVSPDTLLRASPRVVALQRVYKWAESSKNNAADLSDDDEAWRNSKKANGGVPR